MAGRYLATELQDESGNVIYPHTEADVVFTTDGTTVEENLGGDITDTEIQEIFSNRDVQLETGKKLSVKEKIKKTLKRYQTLLGMRILDTVEEVEANTDDGYLMGAKAGAALINDLEQRPNFIIDSATGKITGYTTQEGGAGTVFPFNVASFPSEMILYSNTSIAIPIDGTTLIFTMETLHEYINFYVDGIKNGASTNLFTQTAGGNYTGDKSFNISNYDTVRFRTTAFNSYATAGRVKITNIKVN